MSNIINKKFQNFCRISEAPETGQVTAILEKLTRLIDNDSQLDSAAAMITILSMFLADLCMINRILLLLFITVVL